MAETVPPWKQKYVPTVYQIVCWRCKRAHITLENIRDSDGKKTKDYTCADCKVWGDPPIGNVSRVILKKSNTTVTPPTEKLNAKTLPSV